MELATEIIVLSGASIQLLITVFQNNDHGFKSKKNPKILEAGIVF